MQNIYPKLENHFQNKMLKKNLESISLKSLNKVQAANERVYMWKVKFNKFVQSVLLTMRDTL